MILACPSCFARFKVKAEALGPQGRTVRCAKCGHKWFAAPEEPTDGDGEGVIAGLATSADAGDVARDEEAAREALAEATAAETAAPEAPAPDDDYPDTPPPPPPPEPERGETFPFGPDDTFEPRQREPRTVKKSPVGAWIVLAVLVLGVALGGLFFRHEIVKAYRPANAVFAAIGLPVDTLGFGLEIETPRTRAISGEGERRLIVEGAVRNTTDAPIAVPMLEGRLRDAEGNNVHRWRFQADQARILPGESVSYETSVSDPPSTATGLVVTFTRPEEAAGGGMSDGGGEGTAGDGDAESEAGAPAAEAAEGGGS